MYSWKSARTLVPLILGVAGMICWALYEQFVAPHPLIPLRVMGNRTAAVTFFGTLTHGILVRYLHSSEVAFI